MLYALGSGKKSSQRREHVARADGVDTNVLVSPLDGQAAGKVADSRLGSVVGSLWLGDVHNGA